MSKAKSDKHSMTVTIFLNTFLVGTLIYFLCAFAFINQLYRYFENQIYNELEVEAQYILHGINSSGEKYLDNIDSTNRITLIHKDGTVFFDNKFDVSSLENHRNRQEVLEALDTGRGKSSRYSDTVMERSLYYALLVNDSYILRLSCDQHSVGVLVLGMSQDLILLFIVALVISGLLASILSKKITEPLNKIDLDDPLATPVFDELKPFTKRIAEENYEKSKREELRQQFTANVSHELKTPLTSISGFAEIMKAGNIDSATMKDFAGNIYDEAQHLIVLVNDIIKLSKLDEQSITLEKEELSLNEILQHVLITLEPVARSRNIKIKTDCSSVHIMGVSQVIYEIIYNLCDNAIKYNKDGGEINITIRNDEVNKKAIFKIQDTGIGIPLKDQDRVFERFYCVDKSHSKQVGGTGLGLSIVKHGAKYHNATISLKSEEGVGSTFKVSFPAI